MTIRFSFSSATILSAQSTDEMVNKVTPGLFAVYPDAASMATAAPAADRAADSEPRAVPQQGASLSGMAAALMERHRGEVPTSMEDLTALPGVGRKTANVVRSVAFGLPGLPVDTHVGRICPPARADRRHRPGEGRARTRRDVVARDWGDFSLRMILHGRAICIARRPKCSACVLVDFCPSAEPSKA